MTDETALPLDATHTIDWTDPLPTGLTAQRVHFGRNESGVGPVQVAILTAGTRPTKAALSAAWRLRGTGTTMPVLVAAVHPEGVWLFDNSGDPLGPIPLAQAFSRMQSVLDEPDGISALQQIRMIQQVYASGNTGGFANHFLFANYHLTKNVPVRPDWGDACRAAQPLVGMRGRKLIKSLGFDVEESPGSGNALVLRCTSGQRRAVAVLLDESASFEQPGAGYQLSPVALGLELAGREDVPWLIVMRKDALRLYPGRDGVGVGQRGQSETYFELNLALVDSGAAGLLSLVFSASALERGGTTDQILEGSGKYAADLGSRLRDRIYLEAVPELAVAVAERLEREGHLLDAAGLQFAYSVTLRVLFRVLFQAYAEDSGLLPSGRNQWYDANSLQAFVQRETSTIREDFSDEATSIWQDLRQVWDAIYSGNSRWEVPAYGGSLFDPETPEGAALKRIDLPDRVLGPALQAILTEDTDEGVRGPVDFRSLQVREFGTIYEGLLESALSLAAQDLAVDSSGAFVPAGPADLVAAVDGKPYFHSASGERKATGSYFTPKIVVDHLIERSITPTLEVHLGKVKALLLSGKERHAAELFWDYRVADLAMGSAHFLVAAIDKIERGMRDFLTAHPVPAVMEELTRLEAKAKAALGDDVEAAANITRAQLLRRQIARRCVYGLDINPFAVELARLGIWIHTFVPGLPMSNLDHGLVCANSLTGIGTIDEAIDALVGSRDKHGSGSTAVADDDGLFGAVKSGRQESGYQLMVRKAVTDYLQDTLPLLADVANASEASKREAQRAAELLAEAKAKAAPASRIFDAAAAVRLGEWSAEITRPEHITRIVESSEPHEIAAPLNPAHMPVLFPEVFVRDRPGFDVVVGNPPWEELVYEEIKFWALRFPGLKGHPPAQQKALIEQYRSSRPDLVTEMEAEKESANRLRAVLATGPYPGLEHGHADLYKAFSWRFLHMSRIGGRFSVVLPRTAIAALGSAGWRKAVQATGRFDEVVTLLNTGGWVFPGVHGQYSVGLISVALGSDGDTGIAGPYASESSFAEVATDAGALRVSSAEINRWTASAAFPQLPTTSSLPVFLRLREAPNVIGPRMDLDFAPVQGDFNQTTDSGLFDVGATAGEVPVLKGASFDIWQPDFGAVHGFARYTDVRSRIEARLARQTRTSSSAYFGLDASQLIAEKNLPMDRARVAFRDITNQTNSRTTVASLLPPGVVLINSAPFLVNRSFDSKAEAFVLGVLSSIPLDWYSRRYVELHLNFHIFNDLPVPLYTPGTAHVARTVQVAGRLAAVDERYREWAAEVGVEVGTAKQEPVKSGLVAELDALVSLLYGLTEEQVRHIFSTFHRGWNYQPRLDAVLEHYRAWEGRS